MVTAAARPLDQDDPRVAVLVGEEEREDGGRPPGSVGRRVRARVASPRWPTTTGISASAGAGSGSGSDREPLDDLVEAHDRAARR